jgi:hypothetical protein
MWNVECGVWNSEIVTGFGIRNPDPTADDAATFAQGYGGPP